MDSKWLKLQWNGVQRKQKQEEMGQFCDEDLNKNSVEQFYLQSTLLEEHSLLTSP